MPRTGLNMVRAHTSLSAEPLLSISDRPVWITVGRVERSTLVFPQSLRLVLKRVSQAGGPSVRARLLRFSIAGRRKYQKNVPKHHKHNGRR